MFRVKNLSKKISLTLKMWYVVILSLANLGLLGYFFYIRLGYFFNLFSGNAVFMALSCYCYLLAHAITFFFIKEQVTFVTRYEVLTLHIWYHCSKNLEFHKNSLPINLSQAMNAAFLPRRRGIMRSVSPLLLPHLFCWNVT